jgi:hypothetical protein
MIGLAHQALITFIEHNACDNEHPVIMDQVFGAQLFLLENKKTINRLRVKIRRLRDKVRFNSSMRRNHVTLPNVDRLSHELFDLFNWNLVTTELQAAWKEYFHILYELLVYPDGDDATTNVLLARAIVEYHDALEPPEQLLYNDPVYSLVSSIESLFRTLKREQHAAYNEIGDVKEFLRNAQKTSTELQYQLIELQKEVRELESDNKKYVKILKWSVRGPR